MVRGMDLTAATRNVAEAAYAVGGMPPTGSATPVLSGLRLDADRDRLVLAGNDRERAIQAACTATVHSGGAVLVPAVPLAETLRTLEDPVVRLVVEGSRLVVRVPNARFALPLLDLDLHPGVPELPPKVAEVDAGQLVAVLGTVTATASRDDSLPMFTGVRLCTEGERLRLVASDRYRMAVAKVPIHRADDPLDTLVPATLLAEIGKRATGTVALHAGGNRFGLSWPDSVVSSAVLDGGFLSENAIHTSSVDTRVTVDAGALASAVRRANLYTGSKGVLTLDVGDAEIRVRAHNQRDAEAEETIKAEVSEGRTSPSFQARYLLDALRPFAGNLVRLDIQPGMRATAVRPVEPAETELTYYVMPMLPSKA